MKKLFFFFLINLFTFVQSASYACNFLNVPIGTSITKLYNTYENLYQVDADETDDTVYKYTYRADDFCKEEELNNTYLFVFVQNLKLIGFRMEILHDDLSKDNLFKFTKANIGFIDDKVKNKQWFGTVEVKSVDRFILFSKRKTYDSKLFETLSITTGDYRELLYSPDVEEVMM